ncbi:mechanosensitive ion channel family protein [Oryzihumus sp.]|uniref:mechanosensitive ion channel family protein n=1 Tax=Oryzihumus sp. TaxID=1968903 RepID=UPI002ED8E540
MALLNGILKQLDALTWGGFWAWLSGTPLKVMVTILVGLLARWLVHRFIARLLRSGAVKTSPRPDDAVPRRKVMVLAHATGVVRERQRQRLTTLGTLLRSIATVVIFVVTLLTVLQEVGLPLAPLLTSAGVGGVAIAFGAQSLVKDFISGIFMIAEDQYGVGDIVDTGEVIGEVEDVTLRITRVRDFSGVIWYVRNGEIIRVGNRSQGWSTALVDVPVPYDEDLDKVLPLIREVAQAMNDDETWSRRLLDEPEVVGVESMTGGVVTVRIVARCAANENVPVSRELRERVKATLDRAGIRAPQVLPPYGGGALRS